MTRENKTLYEAIGSIRAILYGSPWLHVHVFDNPATTDRYTIYLRTSPDSDFAVFTMSEDAFSPQGINQFSHEVATPAGIEDMSKALPLARVPLEVVLAILERAYPA